MKNRIYFKIYANNTYSICYYKDNSKNLFFSFQSLIIHIIKIGCVYVILYRIK